MRRIADSAHLAGAYGAAIGRKEECNLVAELIPPLAHRADKHSVLMLVDYTDAGDRSAVSWEDLRMERPFLATIFARAHGQTNRISVMNLLCDYRLSGAVLGDKEPTFS